MTEKIWLAHALWILCNATKWIEFQIQNVGIHSVFILALELHLFWPEFSSSNGMIEFFISIFLLNMYICVT
jgi:hypothetical protein